ncbi:hypothetical protein GCM10011344_20750 [Dokdonia pacifica]|uniref:Uncharacterized protein n=1 Tax=Dokdonia pacifica TaxID=1627892 RepID=A0A238VN10_9FLAO|nr:hypothetical protein [Dokdonia pacifica]GGG19968.1 hypothetical protein GCM10011344_20750 [Dokdonia pacifica]SNR35554.1 hypothetical protein SAMN06265376_10158 [Dokdonia pacifica]
MIRHRLKSKAIDNALWLNFENRTTNKEYVVIQGVGHDYRIVPKDHPSIQNETFVVLPISYTSLSYDRITEIFADRNPLWFWEELKGTFGTLNGELLRFIIAYNIPLEKLIRYSLSARGYDKEMQWVGFNKAKEIWQE